MWRRLWAICRKEWIQIRRDPRTLAVVWALPITQLLLYGYGMDFDLKHIRVAVVDHDRTQASRALVRDFARSEYFEIRRHTDRVAEAERMVVAAEVRQALVIPSGFERALRLGRPAPVQLLLDGADPTTGGTALGYTRGLIEAFSSEWLREHRRVGVWGYGGMGVAEASPSTPRTESAGATSTPTLPYSLTPTLPYSQTPTLPYSQTPILPYSQTPTLPQPLDIRTRVLYNPELRSTNFLVPGLIAVLLTMVAALLTSNAVVREKERGTFEALIATPVKPIELMVGKLIPYVILSFGNVILVMLAGSLFFGVWPRGDLLLLAGLSLIFLLAALGIGLLLSTVAPTQQIALMAAIMATVLPSQLLSGFAFPLRNMPWVLRELSNVFPATHYLVIIRGIYLKDVGLEVLWRPALILAGFAAFLLVACAKRFKKQL